ncbi:hypothetical protein [Nostoc sp.]|uniref:hypothetical protein n=1 Tax=Nostoc sp. TaxID=1180 RepID=UPI002FF6C260
MKIRNAFTKLTICLLLVMISNMVNMHKVSAHPITDCRKLVTGTYLATVSGDFGSFRSIVTFTQDGNYFATASNQSGVPSVQPYGNTQGSWKCIGDREITVTTLNFNYQTATLPASIARGDYHATFDPKTETVEVKKATLRIFNINANPLVDDAPVAGTFTFTGQRVKPGQ